MNNNMKNTREILLKQVAVIAGCILMGGVVLFGIPLLINIAYKTSAPWSFMQTEWDAGNALSFYGTVLGSAVTLVGIRLTLKNEQLQRKKDEAITYKPIIELVGKNIGIPCLKREVVIGYSMSTNANLSEEENDKYHHSIVTDMLYFKNVGRGETSNTRLLECTVHGTNWEQGKDMYSAICYDLYIGEIIKEGHLGIEIQMPQYITVPAGREEFRIEIEFGIAYNDMFGHTSYVYSLFVPYKIFVEEIIRTKVIHLEEDERFAKVRYEIQNPLPSKSSDII